MLQIRNTTHKGNKHKVSCPKIAHDSLSVRITCRNGNLECMSVKSGFYSSRS